MKRYALHVLCLIFCFYSYPAIPFTWIKGLQSVVKPSHAHLSAVNGLVWAQNGIVESMYRYGNDADKTIKAIKELFYLQADEVSFVPTVREDKPAAYWGMSQVGNILAIMQKHRDTGAYNVKACQADLQKLLGSFRSLPAVQAKQDAREELRKAVDIPRIAQIDQIVATLKSEQWRKISEHKIRDLLSERARPKYDAIAQHISEGSEVEKGYKAIRTIVAEEIKRLEAEKKQLYTESKKSKNSSALARKLALYDTLFAEATYARLAEYLAGAIEESLPGEQQKYMPYTIEQVLLAFVWVKANPRQKPDMPKQDFVDFFTPLAEYVDAAQLKRWISSEPYTQKEHQTFETLLARMKPQQAADLITCNRELAIFSVQAHRAWGQKLPTIFAGRTAYYTHNGIQYDFPDCAETSLRNFFDIVLRDRKNNIFSLVPLEQRTEQDKKEKAAIPLVLNQKLISFYKKYSSVTNLTGQALYDEWTQEIENQEGVQYLQHEGPLSYEIKPGVGNVLQVCNHLLFDNSSDFKKLSHTQQLDLICQKLSRTDFELTWSVQDDVDINVVDFATLQFTVRTTRDVAKFSWRIAENHMVIPRQTQTSYPITIEQFVHLVSKFNTNNVSTLASLYTVLSGYVTTLDFAQLMTVAHTYLNPLLWQSLIMLAPLYTQVEKDTTIRALLALSLTQDSSVCEIMKKIVESYIYGDPTLGAAFIMATITEANSDQKVTNNFITYLIPAFSQPIFADKTLEYLFDHNLYTQLDPAFIAGRITALGNEHIIESIATEIMQRAASQFAEGMKPKLLAIKKDFIQIDLTRRIITAEYVSWYDAIGVWLKDTVDDQVALAIINEILGGSAKELFAQAKERAARLPFDVRAQLVVYILEYNVSGWYDFVGMQLEILDDEQKALQVIAFIAAQKIRPLFPKALKKLDTLQDPSMQEQIQKLRALLR